MNELESRLGYEFQNKELLFLALTHSSYANENKKRGIVCNERLEFLGDAVLGVTAAEWLYRGFPELPEGKMSRIRAELVCEQSLAGVARELELGTFLRLGHGEETNGGRDRDSILADAVEAIIAAVYLDGGDAGKLIHRLILDGAGADVLAAVSDYKTKLQELVQRVPNSRISYELESESGPDHRKVFTMSVWVNDMKAGTGTGRSKKEAEQAAARDAMEKQKL